MCIRSRIKMFLRNHQGHDNIGDVSKTDFTGSRICVGKQVPRSKPFSLVDVCRRKCDMAIGKGAIIVEAPQHYNAQEHAASAQQSVEHVVSAEG